MKRKRLLTLIGSLCLVLALAALPFMAACAPEEVIPPPPEEEKPPPPAAPEWPEVISFASAGEGTGSYAVAAGITTLITKYAGIKAVPEASSVGGKTLFLLHNKQVEIAQSFGDAAYDAARGLGRFELSGKLNVRQLWSGPLTPFVVVSRADSGIRSMSDLRGKNVLATHPGNATFTRAMDIFLEAEGMSREDIVDLDFFGSRETGPALKEGRAVASINAMPSLGLPGWIEQLNMEVPVYMFSPPMEKLETVLPKHPYMGKCTLYAKYFGEIIDNKDVTTVGCVNSVFCYTDLPDDLVYEIMKATFDHLEELYVFHKDAKPWTDNPLASTVAPYHPGAIKYYKEKGLWTDEVENIQKQLLAELGASR